MAELGIREEGFDDFVFDEKEAPPEATRWMAVARVHINRPYNQFWCHKNMRATWDLARCKFHPVKDNFYTFAVFFLED